MVRLSGGCNQRLAQSGVPRQRAGLDNSRPPPDKPSRCKPGHRDPLFLPTPRPRLRGAAGTSPPVLRQAVHSTSRGHLGARARRSGVRTAWTAYPVFRRVSIAQAVGALALTPADPVCIAALGRVPWPTGTGHPPSFEPRSESETTKKAGHPPRSLRKGAEEHLKG